MELYCSSMERIRICGLPFQNKFSNLHYCISQLLQFIVLLHSISFLRDSQSVNAAINLQLQLGSLAV